MKHLLCLSRHSSYHIFQTLTFLTQWTFCLRLPLRTPPRSPSAWSARRARTSSPLLSSAQRAPCSAPLPSLAHTTSLFQLAHLIQEIQHPKIQRAAVTPTLFPGPASPLPAPPSTTSLFLPGLSQGMKPPDQL